MAVGAERIAFVLNTREIVRRDPVTHEVTFRGPRNVVAVVTPVHARQLIAKEPTTGLPSGYFLLGEEMGSDNRGPNKGAETKRLAEIQGWINAGEPISDVRKKLGYAGDGPAPSAQAPTIQGGVETGDMADAGHPKPAGRKGK